MYIEHISILQIMQALFVLGNGEGIYMYLSVFRELIIEIS